MTELWGRWQSGVRDFRSNGWQYSAAPRIAARTRAQAHDHMAGIHSDPSGAAGGDRFFHGGSAHAARADDLLRAVFHSLGEPPGGHRGHHRSPGRALDAANGPERDHGGMWRPATLLMPKFSQRSAMHWRRRAPFTLETVRDSRVNANTFSSANPSSVREISAFANIPRAASRIWPTSAFHTQ
jgi:hypothetical protein